MNDSKPGWRNNFKEDLELLRRIRAEGHTDSTAQAAAWLVSAALLIAARIVATAVERMRP